jgi:hypothetical protein
VELVDEDRYRYLSLQFQGDVLIGATSIGLTQHVGVLRGLIQNRTKLGRWKKVLSEAPLRFPEAYVACSRAWCIWCSSTASTSPPASARPGN